MRAGFYAEVTGAVAGLVMFWSGLSSLPPTGWIYDRTPGQDAWTLGAVALAGVGLAATVFLARRAIRRRLPLPPIPGVSARTAGIVAFALAVMASLLLFWWIAASRSQLPVGPVGWAVGAIAIATLAWSATAAGALWSGPERERERERTEARPGKPVGL